MFLSRHSRGAIAAAIMLACGSAIAPLARPAPAAEPSPVESQVHEFRLKNGLTFLVVERHFAPIFSFVTLVDAGGSDESCGKTGIAHMMEHMAFKGTPTIGTTDPKAEAAALQKVDEAWAEVQEQMQLKIFNRADSTRMAEAQARFEAAETGAQKYVVGNAFSKILEENGVEDLNAFTTEDLTAYFYSLPSNKLELWALLEGDRMTYPVFREFYKEREVVIEERRMRVESPPRGRLSQEVQEAAFAAHPYRNGVIGFRSDLEAFGRKDAEQFFRGHYTAANMVIAVVGDVKTEEVKRLAEKYFSAVPAGVKNPGVPTIEPEPLAERYVRTREKAQPLLISAYWGGPSFTDPEYLAADALMDILASGRSSRLYTSLVKQRRIATNVSASAGVPGTKYPNLCWFTAAPAPGVSPDTLLNALSAELARIRQKPITSEELGAYRNRARADFIEGLRSNRGLAFQLALYQTRTGDWHDLFRYLDRIDRLTPEEITTQAERILTPIHRTAGIMESVPGGKPRGETQNGGR